MLKIRAITYVVLVTAVVLGVLLLPSLPFFVISGLIFLIAAFEWSRLAGFTSIFSRVGVVVLIIVLMLLLCYLILFAIQWFGVDRVFMGGTLFAIVCWLLALIAICTYPKNRAFLKSRITGILAGWFVLTPWFIALNLLHAIRPELLLYALILIWMADTAAYFAGRWFGKHTLALQVSPGKTWEGVIGAFIATIVISVAGYLVLDLNFTPMVWILLNIKTVAFSIVGDLFESLFKRMRDLKDSGKLLPGHGGVLDRIDSLTAALPLFTLGFVSLGGL